MNNWWWIIIIILLIFVVGLIIYFTINTTSDNAPNTPDKPFVNESDINSNSITLHWIKNDNSIVYYDVYRNNTKINTTNITNMKYIDTNLQPNTTYDYYIIGFNNNNVKSSPSDILQVKTNVKPILSTPTNIMGDSTNTSTTIYWSKVQSATNYNIIETTQDTLLNASTCDANTCKLTHYDLVGGTTYKYKIQATNNTDTSDWSDEKSITTKDDIGEIGKDKDDWLDFYSIPRTFKNNKTNYEYFTEDIIIVSYLNTVAFNVPDSDIIDNSDDIVLQISINPKQDIDMKGWDEYFDEFVVPLKIILYVTREDMSIITNANPALPGNSLYTLNCRPKYIYYYYNDASKNIYEIVDSYPDFYILIFQVLSTNKSVIEKQIITYEDDELWDYGEFTWKI